MTDNQSAPRKGTSLAFAYVTTLFFAWGFVTSLIGPLIAAVRRVFELSYTEATLTTFAWFIAYGIASIPAAAILGRLGYSKAIIVALVTMVAGCLIVPIATLADFYPGVLIALFVIASGVTLLQVGANPLVAALGAQKSSHARLNFSQFFNSLGTTLGPLIAAPILLTGGVFAADAVITDPASRAESLRSIDLAFLAVAVFFAVVAGFIFSARKTINAAAPAPSADDRMSPLVALKSPWAVFGALAIFFYVGSEVTIGDLLTNFLHSPQILNIPLAAAGSMVAWYWGGAMVGRLVGGLLMLTKIPATTILIVNTAVAAALCLVVTQTSGTTAAYAAIAIGFFNSIMFPTIFTLTLERSTAPVPATSGLLVFGIIGGAVLPPVAGQIADNAATLNPVFYVPLVGYLLLVGFAIAASRAKTRNTTVAATPGGH
ncbi:glucose/galactose MFS transporter [Brevundimonas sp. Root1423]|uniref:glucose/galactose MFS transporter n=1 Tax=Brevundimonas sp. Root1423 TaxID=1736462 RepID=UPI0006F99822|nr:glucose/galactose MFS transporter [Brevundimonas sp. Root1423]KQY84868.1 MFS transporter [Brevundimonas sp. Root1423]